MNGLTVVKVGGSLYDLPDLGPRLVRCLRELEPVLVVPGGGASADVVRAWDRQHGLGEEAAHWLALRSLSLNAHFLAQLLPGAPVVQDINEDQPCAILDAYAFGRADEGRPGALPHMWDVTSDALAARVAVVARARRLLLLKSTDIPPDIDWAEAGACGLVDRWFARALRGADGRMQVQGVNFRTGTPTPCGEQPG